MFDKEINAIDQNSDSKKISLNLYQQVLLFFLGEVRVDGLFFVKGVCGHIFMARYAGPYREKLYCPNPACNQ